MPMKETMERTVLGEAILKHWRENYPQMGRGLGKGDSPGAGGVRGTDPDGRRAVRAGVGEEDGLSGGVGTGEGGVGVAPERERELETKRGTPPRRDFPPPAHQKHTTPEERG